MDGRAVGDDSESWEIARRLVRARLHAEALPVYPGALPATLEAGYACQDAAIALWHAPIAGWKVGRIPDVWLDRMGEERLVGPIFADRVQTAPRGVPAIFPVIPGGFAAVEAEFVFRLGTDAPPRKRAWTEEEALALVDALWLGVEFAGSPLPRINDLGPAVVVSDFGNNAGLVLAEAVPGWRERLGAGERALRCSTEVEGRVVGRGGAAEIVGGLCAALRFALARCARRGMPLRAGQWVSTGAATGIHDILAGQRARIVFDDLCEVDVLAVPATPTETTCIEPS
ncbi:MAG: 2-keto-4-pentenoate hydratase [Pseudomonadota bacterium]